MYFNIEKKNPNKPKDASICDPVGSSWVCLFGLENVQRANNILSTTNNMKIKYFQWQNINNIFNIVTCAC